MQGFFSEPPKALTRKPSEACYSYARGSSYAVRSSPYFKHHNAPISMRVVMDSGGYLCMAIATIKRRDLDGYKEIITCKSCSYVDPKYLHAQWQLRQV